MKEPAPLREALASFTGPVSVSGRSVYFPGGDGSTAEVTDNNRAVYEDCAHVVQDDQCDCLEACEENEKQKARAIVAAVNLAGPLAAVAEAAEDALKEAAASESYFPTSMMALRSALAALKAAAASKEGA